MILILDPDVEQHIRQARRTPPVNHVAIESALTAIAIRAAYRRPPPISASASDSSSAVCAASRSSGTPAGVANSGFSRTHQHLAHPLLQRLDPLAHRRRRDMQPLRCRIEAAVLDHRGERGKLLTVDAAH